MATVRSDPVGWHLKLNDRVKELLADKNRLKIDVRMVHGKSELQPAEITWLREQSHIRTSFCKNLHAKCYLNEELCIVTSLNLYEFSQVNNNEMGILIRRGERTGPGVVNPMLLLPCGVDDGQDAQRRSVGSWFLPSP
jgi:hypothetical protein